MRDCVGKVARVVACAAAIGWGGVSFGAPAFAQQKAPQAQGQQQGKPQAQAVKPGQPAKPKPFDVCKGLTGANAAQKVEACTEAIRDGNLAGGELSLAYLYRGQSESGPGS